MCETIQERLRGPIKHPQECVNQKQEAADHIDALEERCEAYKGQVEAGSKRIAGLEAENEKLLFCHQWIADQARKIDELTAALRKAHQWLVKNELRAARVVTRIALAKLDADTSDNREGGDT